MKKSLSFLPGKKQRELKSIVELTCKILGDDCGIIILFGDYAKDKYVDYNIQINYSARMSFISDYDILVITTNKEHNFSVSRKLSRLEQKFYIDASYSITTPVHFSHESIIEINKAIDKSYLYYTDIIKEGILLYNKGNIRLAEIQQRDYDEIGELAKQYYTEKFERATSFFYDVENAYKRNDYKQASFYLHQSVENFYYAIILTFTLYSPKEHNLFKISRCAKRFAIETAKAFPCGTENQKRLFRLLDDAYLQARYNPHFVVSKEDLDALILSVSELHDIIRIACETKILEYSSQTTCR